MEVVTQLGIALLRKFLFALLLLAFYVYMDRRQFGAFDTAKELRNDPKAIAILLAGLSLAVALS